MRVFSVTRCKYLIIERDIKIFLSFSAFFAQLTFYLCFLHSYQKIPGSKRVLFPISRVSHFKVKRKNILA